MSSNPTNPTPSLSHLQWRAPEWIQAFGPLQARIVMDYFVLSPFFDPSSNNNSLRMQMMFSRQQGGGAGGGGGLLDGLNEEIELRRFKGIEYVLVHQDAPGLFIIHKRWRESPTQVHTLSAYHILNDSIYEAPSLYQVINERMLTSLHALSSSLRALKARKPPLWSSSTRSDSGSSSSTATTIDATDDVGSTAWTIFESPTSTSTTTTTIAAVDDSSRKKRKLELFPTTLIPGMQEQVATEEEEGEQEQEDEDEDEERASDLFNPFLFNALNRVARELQPPAPPPPTSVGGAVEPTLGSSGMKATTTTTQPSMKGEQVVGQEIPNSSSEPKSKTGLSESTLSSTTTTSTNLKKKKTATATTTAMGSTSKEDTVTTPSSSTTILLGTNGKRIPRKDME